MLRFPHDEARSPRALAVPGCAAQTGPTIDVRDLSNICNNEKRFKNAGPPARISASRDARGWAANSTITIVSRRENSRVPPKRRPVATYANPTPPKPGQTFFFVALDDADSGWLAAGLAAFAPRQSTAKS